MASRRWRLGVALIVTVALIWTASSVLVQAIFAEYSFYRPFFLTYVANSLFIVLLPARALASRLGAQSKPSAARAGRADVRSAVIVAPIWFFANFTYNASLGLTSITSSTVIASSSSAFTFLLSLTLLREPYAHSSLAGVLLCWMGNAVTAWSDSVAASALGGAPPSGAADGGTSPALGDALCLLSAILYAAYTVAIRRAAPADLSLFLGSLGATVALSLAPVVLALHASGVEALSALTPTIGVLLVAKGLADNVLSDYLWARALLLTSPLVATIGLSLTVPLAMLADAVIPATWKSAARAARAPSPLGVAGACLVVGGFVAVSARRRAEDEPTAAGEVAPSAENADGNGAPRGERDEPACPRLLAGLRVPFLPSGSRRRPRDDGDGGWQNFN